MAYSGKFRPINIEKYRGNHLNIIYRSLWERKFMKYCDKNPNILEWGSEEIIIPYRSPLDNRIHRYFPDFYIKVRENTGQIKKYIIEVKPNVREVYEYAKNQAKWKAAKEYCLDRSLTFKILTEDHLGV